MAFPELTPKSTLSAISLPSEGNRTEVNSLVPYQVYSDPQGALYSPEFSSGAADQVKYVYKKLGGDILDIELTTGNVYTAYEEAVLEYSYIVNVHQATNIISDALGNSTGSFDDKGTLMSGPLSSSLGGSHVNLKYPIFEYAMSRRISEGVSSELGMQGSRQYSGSFQVNTGQQDYDLQEIISSVTNVSATGKVTVSNNINLSLGEEIEITATDGTSIVARIAGITSLKDTNKPTFAIGATTNDTAANLANCLDANSKLSATAAENVVTITQKKGGIEGNTEIKLTEIGASGLTKEDFKEGSSTTPYAGKLDGKKILIKKVYYKTPHAMWRFYGYYGGLNVVGNLHNYGQFSDDSTFQLIPTWQNKAQALAFEDAIYTRMSHFSYELRNNKLRLYPAPANIGYAPEMWVDFSIPTDVWVDDSDPKAIDGINNMNNLPFGNLPYNSINAIGKQWIRRFALSVCKEMLGQVRSKFGSIPVPGETVQLNGADLIAQGKEEQEKLRTELKETLAEITYVKMAEADATLLESTQKVVGQMPNYIFVG